MDVLDAMDASSIFLCPSFKLYPPEKPHSSLTQKPSCHGVLHVESAFSRDASSGSMGEWCTLKYIRPHTWLLATRGEAEERRKEADGEQTENTRTICFCS